MKSLRYDQVALVPKYSQLESRKDADISAWMGKRIYTSPIVMSNMQSVINEEIAEWLASHGYLYIMHRFPKKGQSLADFSVNFCRRMHEKGLYSSISLGVKGDSVKAIYYLLNEGIEPDIITLDIAHAHSINGRDMLERIRNSFTNSFIIAGNVCTPEGVQALEYWGANAVKVGIGSSPVCTTRNKTGFGLPMFSCLLECCKVNATPIIADSGIREYGDVAKALVAGADMVMLGSLLSAHIESPGEVVEKDGIPHKSYYGSASARNKGEYKNVEGIEKLIPLRGSIKDTYREMEEDLQSAISYAGGYDLSAFNNVEWRTIY